MSQHKSLTNLQQELLKVFSMEVSDKELLDIKNLIAGYFSNKAMDIADKIWEEKAWTVEDAEKMAYTRMRKSDKKET